jgi:metal-responsive CopG/Arc/MetJ family transcriptional regulator
MKKKPITLKVEPSLMERLDAFLRRADLPVTRTAFIETAIRESLDAREGRARSHANER